MRLPRRREASDPGARQRVTLGSVSQRLVQLPHESALADSGNADECDQLWGAAARTARASASRSVASSRVSPDERGAAAERNVDAEARRCVSRPPTPAPAPPFLWPRTGATSRYLTRCSRRPARGVVDEDPVDRRGRLQARGGVDDVAGRKRFALLGARVQVDERFAGRKAYAVRTVRARRGIVGVQLRDRVADRGSGVERHARRRPRGSGPANRKRRRRRRR